MNLYTSDLASWPILTNIPSQAIFATCTLAILSLLLRATYNAFFHPLRNFPGPLSRAVSCIPHVKAVLRGDLEFQVLELHQRYGSVVRIAPNELSFTDGEAWQDIYGRHAKNRENPRDHSVHPPFDSVPGSMEETLLFANTKNHSHLRRIAGPAFNPTAVKKQSHGLQRLHKLFISQLAKAADEGATIDLGLWFELLYSDHAGELVFGEPFGCLESKAAHPIMDTIFHTVEPAVYASALNRFGLWKMINPLIPPQLKALENKLYASAYAVADERIARGVLADSDDLFNHLLRSKKDSGWTDDGLRANGLHFVIAGSETVAFALTGITWLLCTHPRSSDKLRHEIESAAGADGNISTTTLAGLPFLNAVIWEGLRLYPPGALNAPRLISSEDGQKICGHHVPYNTTCSIHHYAAFRSSTNFARPDEFIPDRWLENHQQDFQHDRRETLQPFSVGPRNCIASQLALVQMRTTIAELLFHFDLKIVDSSYDWHSQLKAYWIWKRAPLPVMLHQRRSENAVVC